MLKEITEHNAAFNFGEYNLEMIDNISALIENLYNNRKLLLQMHVNTKNLIDENGTHRILETLKSELW